MVAATPAILPPPRTSSPRWNACSDLEIDECWICLSSEAPGTLARVCDCPRVSHRECLARWQLTNYGRREENFCRFCNKRLPALWKPTTAKEAEKEELRVAPVMAVRYNGPEGSREFKLRVRPGPEGLATFKAHLKEILGFDVGPEFDVTFECQMPSTGSMLTLSGLNAYGAATHCAALLAANKASAQAPAMPPPPAGTTGFAEPLAARSSLQQQREYITQSQQQGSRVRPMPRSLEPPLTTAASAGAVSGMVRLPYGFRRVCQTGYLPHNPDGALQSDLTGAFRSGAAPYPTPFVTRARTMGPAMSRSFGRAAQRHSRRASAGTFLANVEDVAWCDEEAYDDLVPFRLRHGASTPLQEQVGHNAAHASASGSDAAASLVPDVEGGGDIADRGSVGRMETWSPGPVRFGGRVLPTGPSDRASPAGAAAATDLSTLTPTPCTGARSAHATYSQDQSAGTDHDVRRGPVEMAPGSQGGGAGSSASGSVGNSGNVCDDSTGSCDSTGAVPGLGLRSVYGPVRRSSGDPAATFADGPSGSHVRPSSRSRMRLPFMIRQAARHTVDSVARALMLKK